MRPREFLWLLIVALATLGSGQTEAGLLALQATGAFGPTSTLGGTAFGAHTPYSFRAVFDPAMDRNPMPGDGAGYFRATQFTITIEGYGTFEGIPNDDLNVALLDPTYHLGIHAAGLLTSRGEPFFLDAYSAVAPPFDPHAPTPATFLGYLRTLPGFPYVVPLAGGAGELVINDAGDTPRTASLVAVPEPSSLVLAGLGGLALFVGRKRVDGRSIDGSLADRS
jgi:PEP-CTERM motif